MPEEEVGTVTHYFSHLAVAAIDLTGELKVGDTIHIKGHTSDWVQQVDSMQLEHESIEEAHAGQSIGIKTSDHAREHDKVFRVV